MKKTHQIIGAFQRGTDFPGTQSKSSAIGIRGALVVALAPEMAGRIKPGAQSVALTDGMSCDTTERVEGFSENLTVWHRLELTHPGQFGVSRNGGLIVDISDSAEGHAIVRFSTCRSGLSGDNEVVTPQQTIKMEPSTNEGAAQVILNHILGNDALYSKDFATVCRAGLGNSVEGPKLNTPTPSAR
ncbi:MAG: hypothetical protein H6857_03440 [Rhodospirillales bacterium]|nr:hypothetical protein [Rhodospirillales bacterium]